MPLNNERIIAGKIISLIMSLFFMFSPFIPSVYQVNKKSLKDEKILHYITKNVK